MYFCRVGESLQLFFWFPNSLFFSPPLKPLCISCAPITSHYGCESQTTFGFCLFFLFFFLLYQSLCPVHSLQVPGIPLATGKQQDCLLYLVTIATGLECEAIMVALHCAEGRPVAMGCCWVCGCQSRHVSGDLCCLPIALIVSTAGWSSFLNSDLLRMWFSLGVQVDDASCYSQESSKKATIYIVFPPAPILKGEFYQI